MAKTRDPEPMLPLSTIKLFATANAEGDRSGLDLEFDNFFQRQQMCPAQIEIGIQRRKPIKMRAADGGEEQRIRLRRDDAMEAWGDGHVRLRHYHFEIAEANRISF